MNESNKPNKNTFYFWGYPEGGGGTMKENYWPKIICRILGYMLIFNTINFQWIREIREYCQKKRKVIPIVIAGLQKNKTSTDTRHRGEQLAARFKEVAEYVECTDDKVNRFYLLTVLFFSVQRVQNSCSLVYQLMAYSLSRD